MDPDLDLLLADLASAPDSQLDRNQAIKLDNLIGKSTPEIVDGLAEILRDCCSYSLASDFAMGMLQRTYDIAVRENDKKIQ